MKNCRNLPEPVPEGECVYYAPDEVQQRPPFEWMGLDAGDFSANAERTIELVRFEHNGSVDYKMQNCDGETYPLEKYLILWFQEVLTLKAFQRLDIGRCCGGQRVCGLVIHSEQAENGVIGSDYILDWLETPYSH